MQRKSERIFRIYQRLKSLPQTIDELYVWSKKVDLGIGRRTLYRYLDELENTLHEPGFELVTTNHNSKEKRWQVVRAKRTNDEERSEALRRYYLLKYLSGKHLDSLTDGYLETIERELNQHSDLDHRNGMLRNHLITTGWAEASYSEKDIEVLMTLLRAIENKELVTLELLPSLSAEKPLKGVFDWSVHFIISHRGTFYAAAMRKGHKRFYFLDIESVSKISYPNMRFRKHPAREEVEQELARRFGITHSDGPVYNISILFPTVSSQVNQELLNPFLEKRSWHPTQRFVHGENGQLILQFRSPLNRELLGWVLMYMDQIKVLGPPQLITMVERKMAEIHAVLNGKEPGESELL